MNIAVLIGISQYFSASDLPGCDFDVDNMKRLLDATRKYEDILVIKKETNANNVKESLRTFFSKYQKQTDIDEAFIYFSGHGTYVNDALLCCTDFDANRPSSTSISNSELDDLLRSVNPGVAVKVIDACQSGSQYIKDPEASFEKAFRTSTLKAFICMTSSHLDQSSYASSTESFFTTKWIDAALVKPGGTVLYRDIQAEIADAFVSNQDQTPFFVTQGTGLEAFSTITQEMKSLLSHRKKAPITEAPEQNLVSVLEAEIQKRDSLYVSKDIVFEVLNLSRAELEISTISDPVISKFFDRTISIDPKLAAIPKIKDVANYAEDQGWVKKYFVHVKQESYQTRVLKEPLKMLAGLNMFSKIHDDSEYSTVTRLRPTSIESTEVLPFEVVVITYSSRHRSIPGFQTVIGLVHSLTEVVILSAVTKIIPSGWDSATHDISGLKWKFYNSTWREVVENPFVIWRSSVEECENEIRKFMTSILPDSETTDDSKTKEKAKITHQMT